MRAGRTGGLACAAALCLPWLAQAEARDGGAPLVVALAYAAVPDCPDESEFKAIVMGRLGYNAFREGVAERVLVHIAPGGPAYEGRIEWRDAEGKWAGDRTFPSRSNDCRELARAMAFALALQIQLSASGGAPPGSSPTTPAETLGPAETPAPSPGAPTLTPAPSKQPDVPVLTQEVEAPDRGPRALLAIGAGASVGFGVSSRALPLGRVFGSIAGPRWSLELAAVPATARREA